MHFPFPVYLASKRRPCYRILVITQHLLTVRFLRAAPVRTFVYFSLRTLVIDPRRYPTSGAAGAHSSSQPARSRHIHNTRLLMPESASPFLARAPLIPVRIDNTGGGLAGSRRAHYSHPRCVRAALIFQRAMTRLAFVYPAGGS